MKWLHESQLSLRNSGSISMAKSFLVEPRQAYLLESDLLAAWVVVDSACSVSTESHIQSILDATVDTVALSAEEPCASYFQRKSRTVKRSRSAWLDGSEWVVWNTDHALRFAYGYSFWTGRFTKKSVHEVTVEYGKTDDGKTVIKVAFPPAAIVEPRCASRVLSEIYWGCDEKLPAHVCLIYLSCDFDAVNYDTAEAVFGLYQLKDRYLQEISFDTIETYQSGLDGCQWPNTLASFFTFVEKLEMLGKVTDCRYSQRLERNLDARENVIYWLPVLD